MEILIFFLTGLFFGSFANVVSLRLHSGKKGIVSGHSECPRCGHLLSWWENIPLFSWIFLRGKCHHCHAPISWQYPAVEIFFGVLFTGTVFFRGLENPRLFGITLLFVVTLGIIALSDLRYFEIPDEASLPAIFLALITASFSLNISPPEALWGAFAVYGFFAIFILLPSALTAIRQKKFKIFFDGFLGVFLFPAWLFFALFGLGNWFEKKVESGSIEEFPSWIGGGDLRLAVLMGLLLGPVTGVLSVFLGCLIGTIVLIPLVLLGKKSRKDMVPFGPFLVCGAIGGLWWGNDLLEGYLRILGY